MSRLDDELKIAFKREEPSQDFAARVLERINSTPAAPKQSFRQRLAAFFPLAGRRWVAIGAAAALLIAIGATQYQRLRQTANEEGGRVEAVNATPSQAGDTPAATAPTAGDIQSDVKKAPPIKHTGPARRGRAAAIAVRKGPRPSPEAEAAKERVLFALQVAGAALNDVQKAIHDDGPDVKPEPLNNR
jgi:hypothetical protein